MPTSETSQAVTRRDPGFWRRMWAMVIKEVIQMRRDRMTFAMMLAIPILQLVLFGYAINTDPRNLPTAVLARDQGPLTRSLVSAIRNTGYFDIVRQVQSPREMDELISSGKVLFGIEIPADFERDVRRGEKPYVLVIADASDPTATGGAISALQGIIPGALTRELRGPSAITDQSAFRLRIHKRYNPEGETQLNIVPGLLGVILTMTMMLFTALAVTREIERGTMENLLSMPIKPVEIMLGKILPFVAVGFIQMAIILLASRYLFNVPVVGSLGLLVALTTLFAGGEPCRRLHILHDRPESASGGADDVHVLSAEHPAVRLHVSVRAACRNGRR